MRGKNIQLMLDRKEAEKRDRASAAS